MKIGVKDTCPCLSAFLGTSMDKIICDGTEDIQKLKNQYMDTSQLRITNMVYKAIYAIAHAIHNVVCQEANATTQCDRHTKIKPSQVRL